jgi:hypothetical protein
LWSRRRFIFKGGNVSHTERRATNEANKRLSATVRNRKTARADIYEADEEEKRGDFAAAREREREKEREREREWEWEIERETEREIETEREVEREREREREREGGRERDRESER